MNYKTILNSSLLSAIEEIKCKHNIICDECCIHVKPDVSEKELSKINSLDLYYRDAFVNGFFEKRTYSIEEVATMFAPSFGVPLWMEMSLLSYEGNCIHILLSTSIRFRKTKELLNSETGHPPIRVV